MWLLCAFILVVGVWKLGCKHLRKRRLDLLLSIEDCHARNACTLFVEFPFLYKAAFEYGLMRSSGIPAITRRVKRGGQVAQCPSKRYDDTDILIREMLLHHIDSPRGSLAVQRLNFLHSHYNICNEDYVYVLALHIITVIEWASMFGYREWTEKEKSTHYKVWHDIGTRMGMHNIPASIAELTRYKEEYEAKYMVFADENREAADAGMRLLLGGLPELLRPITQKMLISLLDDRLVAALGYRKQLPQWMGCIGYRLLRLHGVAVSWMPPRPLSWAKTRVPASAPGCACFDPDTQLQLAFQCFPPSAYQQGYRISDIGNKKAGKLHSPFVGSLMCCPFQSTCCCSTMDSSPVKDVFVSHKALGAALTH